MIGSTALVAFGAWAYSIVPILSPVGAPHEDVAESGGDNGLLTDLVFASAWTTCADSTLPNATNYCREDEGRTRDWNDTNTIQNNDTLAVITAVDSSFSAWPDGMDQVLSGPEPESDEIGIHGGPDGANWWARWADGRYFTHRWFQAFDEGTFHHEFVLNEADNFQYAPVGESEVASGTILEIQMSAVWDDSARVEVRVWALDENGDRETGAPWPLTEDDFIQTVGSGGDGSTSAGDIYFTPTSARVIRGFDGFKMGPNEGSWATLHSIHPNCAELNSPCDLGGWTTPAWSQHLNDFITVTGSGQGMRMGGFSIRTGLNATRVWPVPAWTTAENTWEPS